jgi:hypothetical protein
MVQPVPASEVRRWWWHPVTAATVLVVATFSVAATSTVMASVTASPGWLMVLVWLMFGAAAGFVTSGST